MASSWNRANNHNESYRGHFWNQSNVRHRFQHFLLFVVDVCGRSTTKVKRVWLGLVSEVETNLTKHFFAKRLLNFFSKTFIKSCPKASSARKEGWEGTSSGPAVTRTTRSWWAARARGSPTFVSPYFIVKKSCAIFMICKSYLNVPPLMEWQDVWLATFSLSLKFSYLSRCPWSLICAFQGHSSLQLRH